MQRPAALVGEYNQIAFIVSQALGKLQTATLVRIVSCTNSGGLSPVGFVDVTPLVNQVDSAGVGVEHTVIHNVPYFRLQGGANAIIIDPEPGDIGIAVFASRDITAVKATKDRANPGSYRQYSFSDALYIGGLLNGTPSQYVRFSTSGIQIHSPTQVKLDAPDVRIDAQTVEINASTSTTVTTPTFTVNGQTVLNGGLSQGKGSNGGSCDMLGPVTVTNDVTAQGTSLHTHKHPGDSGGQTGTPI